MSACPPARRRCLAALCGQRCSAPFAKMLAADALMASAVAWDKLLPEATSPADVELVDFPLLLDDTDASSSDVDSALDAVLLPWDEAEEIDMEPAKSEPWSPAAVKELPRRKGRRRDRVGKSKSKKLSAEAAPIRVRTYTARKNEIEQLNAELPQLEAYVDLLKQQAARTAGKQSSVDKLRLANSKLRDLAHRQQYPLIRVQSAMSRLVTDQQQMVPLDRSIYLSKDSAARSATLMAVQPRVLRDARFFMKERTWHLDTRVLPVREQQSFTSPDGSFCATDFSATRLEGVSSVKRAYDTLRAALSKRDSLFSELSGDCTVCEELDPLSELAERGITHSRIVRSAPGGLLVESNTAEFAEYRPREDVSSDGHDHGLIVFHAIDNDQLHPYLTDQQLRFDVKTVFSVETRMCPSRDPSETPESREDVEEVVISRSSFLKLHRTSLAVSLTEMALTRDRLVQQGNLLIDSVLSILAQQE